MRLRLALWLYRRACALAPEIAVAQEQVVQARVLVAIQAYDAEVARQRQCAARARAAQNN